MDRYPRICVIACYYYYTIVDLNSYRMIRSQMPLLRAAEMYNRTYPCISDDIV
jgi:hypothetical protein